MAGRIVGRWVLTHWRAANDTHGRVLVQGRDALDTLQRYGLFPTWSRKARGWALDDQYLPDVCAIAGLETLGYRVADVDGTECVHTDQRAEGRTQLREIDRSEETCACAGLGSLPEELLDLLGAEELWHEHRAAA